MWSPLHPTAPPMNTFSYSSLSKQAQRELFRFVADCTYDWESWLDLESKLVWVNPAVERLTSFTMAECLAMRTYPLEIVAPADRQAMQAILENAAKGGSGNDREFRVVKKDGSLHWFAVSWQPLVVADGELHRFSNEHARHLRSQTARRGESKAEHASRRACSSQSDSDSETAKQADAQ